MRYRYRLYSKDLPSKSALVFSRKRKVIFVHGCFWHQHPGCRRCTQPASRQDYWLPKLARNVARDAQASSELEKAGWQVLTVWECEVKNEDALLAKLKVFLDAPTS